MTTIYWFLLLKGAREIRNCLFFLFGLKSCSCQDSSHVRTLWKAKTFKVNRIWLLWARVRFIPFSSQVSSSIIHKTPQTKQHSTLKRQRTNQTKPQPWKTQILTFIIENSHWGLHCVNFKVKCSNVHDGAGDRIKIS